MGPGSIFLGVGSWSERGSHKDREWHSRAGVGWGTTPSAAQRRGLDLSALTFLSCMMDSIPADHRVIMGLEWEHRYHVLSQCLLQ